MRLLLSILTAGLSIFAVSAGSNIAPEYSRTYSDWIGSFDWRPNAEHGASINQYYCSGFIYGGEVGWIALGSGAPVDGVRYRNNSAADFGVNVLASGELRGFAYGANIGWINFDPQGNPRVDWTTGRLSGSIYSANAGWIPLDTSAGGIRVDRIAESPDQDNDDLPDVWEIARAGTLTLLTGGADLDSDGLTDRDEYLAGTNPRDREDKLGPITLQVDADSNLRSVQWTTAAGYLYQVERRDAFHLSSSWMVVNSDPIVGTGGQISFGLPVDLAAPDFFRVRAYPPLTQLN